MNILERTQSRSSDMTSSSSPRVKKFSAAQQKRLLNSSLVLDSKSPRSDSVNTSRSNVTSLSDMTANSGGPQLTLDDIKSALEAKATEVSDMKNRITQINSKISELETEKDTYVFQVAEIKKRYARDVQRLEDELASTNEASHGMEEKLSRVHQIEEGIINLFLEMKDRTIEVVREDDEDKRLFEEESERKLLKAENPLVLLDKLKANLRTLLAFKEDFEVELREQINQRVTDVEEKVEEMQIKIGRLETEQEQFKENEIRAIQIKNDAINSKRVIIDESNKRIADMKTENVKLVAELKELEAQISQYHEKLDSRDQKLRDRAIEMTKIEKLDDRMLKDKNKHQFDKNRLKSEHYKTREIYDKELNYHKKVLNEKEKMETEIEEIQKQIEMYKKHSDRKAVLKLEKDDHTKQKRLQKLNDELRSVNQSLRATETKILNMRKENIRIKKRMQQLFISGVNDEKRLRDDEARIQQHFKETTDNQPMASHFKKLYQEKEKEVGDLNKKVKRMVLVERQESKYQKTFEQERNRLEDKLQKLRNETINLLPDDAWKTEEDLRSQNQMLERRTKIYDNMKSLAQTQSNALKKLAGNQPQGVAMSRQSIDLSTTRSRSSCSDYSSPLVANRRPSSAMGTSRRVISASMSSIHPQHHRRPMSAGATHRKSMSSLPVGSSRSSLTPGSLINNLFHSQLC